jgi:hypothetical protein
MQLSSLTMARRRGNPNWGRPSGYSSTRTNATEFEMQVRRLRLTKEDYVESTELRTWCERNKNQRYIPEWLLKALRIEVSLDLSREAR